DHSFIGVYNVKTREVDFIAPSVDFDGSPTWSPDGKRIAFTRRPGTPFGAQAQEGNGGIGNPNGPAAAAQGRGGRGGGGRGGFGPDTTPDRGSPGLYRAAFKGGHTLSFMVADVSTCLAKDDQCEAREFWHN